MQRMRKYFLRTYGAAYPNSTRPRYILAWLRGSIARAQCSFGSTNKRLYRGEYAWKIPTPSKSKSHSGLTHQSVTNSWTIFGECWKKFRVRLVVDVWTHILLFKSQQVRLGNDEASPSLTKRMMSSATGRPQNTARRG